ncbi:MAG: ABC transporter ATP-binding protein [archaeon GB-1867-035]|nr:ABC transporter ATP-binding protein [Candidatus Culexmicrobium profundum]
MYVVEVENLTKIFNGLVAVDSVSFKVSRGEFFGLLGPNGAGKTTIIRMLTGQLKPTRGKAKVLGINVVRNPIKVREVVGIIPEQEVPPSFLTAEEYLEFVGKIRKIENLEERCDWWFKFLEFEDQRNVLCKDLSRGTRQKLMFAQAFIHEPEIAFIDEPLINLDPIIQRKVKDFLKNYVRSGHTVFLCTHVLNIAEELCSRIGIIDRGKIIYDGPLSEIRKRDERLESFFIKLLGGAMNA